MASNHEFTLIPPNMVSNSNEQSNSSSQGTNTGCGKGMTGFKILLPDNTLYDIQLPVNCTGNDCMDQVRKNYTIASIKPCRLLYM